jgi:ketosteroid isomerase-like protein
VSAALVGELAERFGRGDMARAFELLHEGFVVEQPPSLPHGGRFVGREGMALMGARFAEHWIRTITDPRRYECDELCVQITTQTWTARSTGRSATVDVVELFTFRDGLIDAIRVFQQDTHLLLSTLGPATG